MIAIGVGTYLMIQKKETEEKKQDGKWLIYAIGSAVFASLTSILGKVGIQDVNSNLGTAIRTIHGMGGCVCDRKAAYRKADRQIKLDILSVIRN